MIYDLKNVNCDVRISVKLVLKVGVGIIVVGVVKVIVDVIVISGYDGGIGVFLKISIKYIGFLWEFGFVEVY